MVAAGCRIDDVSSALFIPGVTQTCHVLVQGLKTLYSNISLFFLFLWDENGQMTCLVLTAKFGIC